MVQLNRSMMDRYEIADRRPQSMRAVLLGADRIMLGVAARLLDCANEGGADLGAVCVSTKADALAAQDGMFTLLIRGETIDEKRIREERVVQSILEAVDPARDYAAFLAYARKPELNLLFCPANMGAAEILLLADYLLERCKAGLSAPHVLLMGENAAAQPADPLRQAILLAVPARDRNDAFAAWIGGMPLQNVLCESLCGRLSEGEAARVQQQMNYRDDFLGWAEPQLKCCFDGDVPSALKAVCPPSDYAAACIKKARVFDAAVFLCASAGYLCGKNSFAEALKDEPLRAWIGHAFFDEILPCLSIPKDEIAPYIISTFERLENSMNDMPLLEIGRDMLGNFGSTLLPTIRAYADQTLEAPKGLAFALSAAIMLYSGARQNENGEYEILRGNERAVLRDDREILESFARFSHDMPAETLAYAALADRSIWGCDLRDIDGLEMRVCYDLSAIQRIGIRESLHLKTLEWED